MRILVAEDDVVSRRRVEAALHKRGFEVQLAHDGAEAWAALQQRAAPPIALLDWVMPELDGLEVCRRVKLRYPATYVILLTSRRELDDLVAGLGAGADDYVTKPFDEGELHARILAGARAVQLQDRLADRIRELQALQRRGGIVPICAYCKLVRAGADEWQPVEAYLTRYLGLELSHGICPTCFEETVAPQLRDRDPDR